MQGPVLQGPVLVGHDVGVERETAGLHCALSGCKARGRGALQRLLLTESTSAVKGAVYPPRPRNESTLALQEGICPVWQRSHELSKCFAVRGSEDVMVGRRQRVSKGGGWWWSRW